MANDNLAFGYSPEGDALIIRDEIPWGWGEHGDWKEGVNEKVLQELEKTPVVKSVGELSGGGEEYSMVVIPSMQPEDFYDGLENIAKTLGRFVFEGGIMVARLYRPLEGIDYPTFLPQKDRAEEDPADGLSIDGDHPIVADLEDEDLGVDGGEVYDSWGPIRNLPSNAEILIEENDSATYAVYKYGRGRVAATTQPVDYPRTEEGEVTHSPIAEADLSLDRNGGSETYEVTGSTTTLQYIPGHEENEAFGGHPLNGSLMSLISETENVPGVGWEVKPVLDSWLKGDITEPNDGDEIRPGNDELPKLHERAIMPESQKYFDEFSDRSYRIYRQENRVQISFESEDGQTVERDSVEITFDEAGEPTTKHIENVGDLIPDLEVDGDYDPKGAHPVDPEDLVSTEGRRMPMSVTPDHEVNGIPVDDWHDGDYEERSKRQVRFFDYDLSYTHEGVEGVRVTTVTGGYAGFVDRWAHEMGDNPAKFFAEVNDWSYLTERFLEYSYEFFVPDILDFMQEFISEIPHTWSVVDHIVLADGRKYSRVWQASPYPSLAFYVDGVKTDQIKMPYEPKEAINLHVTLFFIQSAIGLDPYVEDGLFRAPITAGKMQLDEFNGREPQEALEAVSGGLSALPAPAELLNILITPPLLDRMEQDGKPIDGADPYPLRLNPGIWANAAMDLNIVVPYDLPGRDFDDDDDDGLPAIGPIGAAAAIGSTALIMERMRTDSTEAA